jgi:ethanolamine utilization protein EutJ
VAIVTDGGASPITDPKAFLEAVERSLRERVRPEKGEPLKVGLDLGTASIVLVVLGEGNRPLGCAREFASVVKDGLVVDFGAARSITARLREELEDALGVELTGTAIAVPSGTGERDAATHSYVASGAGLEVSRIMDEPSAANMVLGVKDGAIVDIGGGTTGIAVLNDGKVVETHDEATGGTHVTLVLAGHNKISFEEAETRKTDPAYAKENLVVVAPVLRKMGSIIAAAINGYDCDDVYLVGGTSASLGIEGIVAAETKKRCHVAPVPILVTPAGIALSDTGGA